MDLRERTSGRVAPAGRHPWELARARFFRRLIGRSTDVGTVRRVLDVGAGDGWFAQELLPTSVRRPRSSAGMSTTARRTWRPRPGRASRGRTGVRTGPSTSSSCWTSSSTSRTTRASWPVRWCRSWRRAGPRWSACPRTRRCSPTTTACSNTTGGTGPRTSARSSTATSTWWTAAGCSRRLLGARGRLACSWSEPDGTTTRPASACGRPGRPSRPR